MDFDWVTTRPSKPRRFGVTMIIDTGMGITEFRDILQLSGNYIDFIKLGFGTGALTPSHILKQKLALTKRYGIRLYPGGTLFEAAYANGEWQSYLLKLKALGFEAVEISEGTVTFPPGVREEMIRTASQSFIVLSEIGKKEKGSAITLTELQESYERDRMNGASYVIVEGRESGKDVGIYNARGELDPEFVLQAQQMTGTQIMWEAPLKSQQADLIRLLGSNVNLGNISARQALALEALRCGLRSDTFNVKNNHIEMII